MNKKKSKTTLAIILVGILGVISIAYAAISTTLFITSGGSASTNPTDGATAGRAYVKFLDAADDDALAPDTNTGIAVSEDVDHKATATAGDVTITTTSKTNDTAIIKGTDLGAFGSYVIYKLEVKNEGSKPAKLTKVPYIENGGCDGGVASINDDRSGVKLNISVRIYTELTDDKKDCKPGSELKIWDQNNDAADNSKANYLGSKESTIWYVKVSYIDAASASGVFTPGTFGFDLNPVWEEVTGS